MDLLTQHLMKFNLFTQHLEKRKLTLNSKLVFYVVASIVCLFLACLTPGLIEFVNDVAPIEYKEMRGDKMVIKHGYEVSINCLGCLFATIGCVFGTNAILFDLKSEDPTGKNNAHIQNK